MGELEIPYRRGEYRAGCGGDTSRREGDVPPSPRGRGLESPDKRIPCASLKYLIGEVSTGRDVGAILLGGKRVCPLPEEETEEWRVPDKRILWASLMYLTGEVSTERDVRAILVRGKGMASPPPPSPSQTFQIHTLSVFPL